MSPPEPQVVPLLLRRVRRAGRIEVALQAIPAAALLASARTRLSESGSAAGSGLAVLQLAVAGLLLLAALRELRGRAGHGRLALVDLASGALLLLEWANRASGGGKLFSATLLSALVSIGFGVAPLRSPDWRNRRRIVRLDAVGLAYQPSRLRRLRAEWSELASLERWGDRMDLVRRDGRTLTANLGALDNAEPVWRAISDAARRAGVVVHDGPVRGEVA